MVSRLQERATQAAALVRGPEGVRVRGVVVEANALDTFREYAARPLVARLDTLLSAVDFATSPPVEPGGQVRSVLCLAVDPDLLVTVNAMTAGYVVNDAPDAGPGTPTHPGAGREAAVPLIVGNTSNDSSVVAAFGIDAGEVLKRLGAAGFLVKMLYPGVKDEADLARQVARDLVFTMPVRGIADRHSKRAPTWRCWWLTPGRACVPGTWRSPLAHARAAELSQSEW